MSSLYWIIGIGGRRKSEIALNRLKWYMRLWIKIMEKGQGLGVEVVWVKEVIVENILVVVQVAASVMTGRLLRRVREIMWCRRVKSIGD